MYIYAIASFFNNIRSSLIKSYIYSLCLCFALKAKMLIFASILYYHVKFDGIEAWCLPWNQHFHTKSHGVLLCFCWKICIAPPAPFTFFCRPMSGFHSCYLLLVCFCIRLNVSHKIRWIVCVKRDPHWQHEHCAAQNGFYQFRISIDFIGTGYIFRTLVTRS